MPWNPTSPLSREFWQLTIPLNPVCTVIWCVTGLPSVRLSSHHPNPNGLWHFCLWKPHWYLVIMLLSCMNHVRLGQIERLWGSPYLKMPWNPTSTLYMPVSVLMVMVIKHADEVKQMHIYSFVTLLSSQLRILNVAYSEDKKIQIYRFCWLTDVVHLVHAICKQYHLQHILYWRGFVIQCWELIVSLYAIRLRYSADQA